MNNIPFQIGRALPVFATGFTLLFTGVCGFAQEKKDSGETELLRKIESLSPDAPMSSSLTGQANGTSPAAGDKKDKDKNKGKDDERHAPTEITSTKEATFDDKTRVAVFIGDVQVKDPQFTITCEKLTAYLRREATQGTGRATPKPSPAAGEAPAKGGGTGGGLERAIAEGNVVIVQDKPAADGGEAQHNVGRSQKAEYNANSGDMILSGRPQVQQGMNMQVATDDSTVMIMNRDGRTMKTIGPSKVIIQESQSSDKKTSQR